MECDWTLFEVLTEWMEKKKRKKQLRPIPTGADWKEYLSRENAFTSWVAGNIKVMAISIHSMPPLNHVDETSGAQCPSNFCMKNPIWDSNRNQVLENQDNNDVFGLLTFDNGDYACMGTLQLTDPVIVDIAKKDTQVIPTSVAMQNNGESVVDSIIHQQKRVPIVQASLKLVQHSVRLISSPLPIALVSR
jgi:hypothetical protein